MMQHQLIHQTLFCFEFYIYLSNLLNIFLRKFYLNNQPLKYHHEAESKGNRKYFTVGAGFKMNVFSLDVGYVIATAKSNPLDQTMRFTLGFDLDGVKDLFNHYGPTHLHLQQTVLYEFYVFKCSCERNTTSMAL